MKYNSEKTDFTNPIEFICAEITDLIQSELKENPTGSEKNIYDSLVKLSPGFANDVIFNDLFPAIFNIQKIKYQNNTILNKKT